jgi:hypothetical protein
LFLRRLWGKLDNSLDGYFFPVLDKGLEPPLLHSIFCFVSDGFVSRNELHILNGPIFIDSYKKIDCSRSSDECRNRHLTIQNPLHIGLCHNGDVFAIEGNRLHTMFVARS